MESAASSRKEFIRLPPALIVAAPASGTGKTTVTLGLLRHLRDQGVKVASAKVGPDYIDPQFHALASGRPCFNLDPWAMRPATLAANLALAGEGADLVIIEGVMGLFDGAMNGAGSTADLAARLRLPVILVVDAHAQAQSAAALVSGFQHFRDDVHVAGVIFNRVGGPKHDALLRSATERLLPVLAAIPRRDNLHFPDRHLGLVQPGERADIDSYLNAVAKAVGETAASEALLSLAVPPQLASAGGGAGFPACHSCIGRLESLPHNIPPPGRHIAVASDVAFSFCYPHLLASWRQAGATFVPFSPLADEEPDAAADAVFLPGGYPELHAARLSGNRRFLSALRAAAVRGVYIYGECGGYMVLGNALIDQAGQRHPMAGLLPLETSFAERRLHLGYRVMQVQADSPLGPTGVRLRGHEFHFANVTHEGDAEPFLQAFDCDGTLLGNAGLRRGGVMGSFMHLIDLD